MTVFIALMLVRPSKWLKQIIQIKHARVKNPNWPEANQLAVFKRGTTVNKFKTRASGQGETVELEASA